MANRAGYLPERDSDSVLAVVMEEGGFFGGAALLLLYGLFIGLIFASAAEMRDRWVYLLYANVIAGVINAARCRAWSMCLTRWWAT